LFAITPPTHAAQGVMSHAIIVGTHLDLSGPLAQWGQATRNGLRMGIEEANAEGGMQGRQIRLIAEDDRYDPATASAVVHKLVNEDRVFAILSPLGTPTVEASMAEALNHGVLHLFPLMADTQSFHPLHPLKFAVTPPYSNDVAAGLNNLLNMNRARKVKIGVLHEANAFGSNILDGVQTALARHELKPAAMVSFPVNTTNFRSEVAKLKAARADIVVLGTVVQDTIAVLRAARTSGWRPIFLCTAACYTPETTTLGGALVEGLYAVADVPIPYANDANAKLRGWAESYQRKFGAPATLQALQGYLNARLFADAVRKTGVLTQMNYAHTLETMGPWTDARLDGLPVKFTPQDHLGMHAGFLARVQKGRWLTQTAPLQAN
jgi:branched-chain amino acid transport system substrate-binding protein